MSNGSQVPGDSITLKYFVRAPTYAQQSRDQKRHIDHLEQQMTLLQQQLNEMNIKYNEEVNKNAAIKRGSTSSNNNVVAAGVSSSSIAKRKFIVKSSSNQQSSS